MFTMQSMQVAQEIASGSPATGDELALRPAGPPPGTAPRELDAAVTALVRSCGAATVAPIVPLRTAPRPVTNVA